MAVVRGLGGKRACAMAAAEHCAAVQLAAPVVVVPLLRSARALLFVRHPSPRLAPPPQLPRTRSLAQDDQPHRHHAAAKHPCLVGWP